MESDLRLQLDTSLHLLAVVASAIHFWEMSEVQNKVQNYFLKPPENFKWDNIDRQWMEIKMLVSDTISSYKLPHKIKWDICCLVDLIERKIISWYRYVMVDLGLDAKFAQKIFWTSQAGIDEAKIFREFWQNEPDFHSSLDNVNGLGSSLFTVACLLAQEDFIRSKSEQMIIELNSHLEATNEEYSIPQIITIWLNFSFRNTEEIEVDELCLISISAGLNAAVKFLVNEFGDNFSQQCLVLGAKICLENMSEKKLSIFKKERYADIFLFLLNKMVKREKIEYLMADILKLFYAFLQVWPYQTFLLQILRFIAKNFNNHFEMAYPSLLRVIIKAENERTGLTPWLYIEMDHNIFMRVFEMGSKHLKRDVLLRPGYDICARFFDTKNFLLLRFIINDNDLLDLRHVIISKGNKLFRMFVTKFMFDQINEIMKKLMLTEIEIKKLKTRCNTLSDMSLMTHYVNCGLINEMDKLLSWLSDSECERINFKTGIKSAEICTLIFRERVQRNFPKRNEFNFIKLDQYLKWQFNTEEEIVDFKLKLDLVDVYRALIKEECTSGTFNGALMYELLNWQFGFRFSDSGSSAFGTDEEKIKEIKGIIATDDFICEQICLLWHLNYGRCCDEPSRNECLKFLNYFYESDEVILNKREKIAQTENFIKNFCDHFKTEKEGKTEIIKKFLEFCNLTGERFIEVKQAMISYNP